VLAGGDVLIVGINVNQAGAGASMTERYSPATGQWTVRTSSALKRMQTELIALPDGQVLVAGGETQTLPAPLPDRLGIVKWCDLYDPALDRWRRVADMLELSTAVENRGIPAVWFSGLGLVLRN